MLKAIIVLLIAAIPVSIGIFSITGDTKPEVIRLAGVDRVGYESIPTVYEVTASPSYRWKHKTGKAGLVVFGFIFIILAAAYTWYTDKHANKGSYEVIFFCWFLAFVLIFGKHATSYYNDGLTKKISEQDYKFYQYDLDYIFKP